MPLHSVFPFWVTPTIDIEPFKLLFDSDLFRYIPNQYTAKPA
ncbi:MAG: hypothetical protein ACFWTN_11190 [Clostridium sp.]